MIEVENILKKACCYKTFSLEPKENDGMEMSLVASFQRYTASKGGSQWSEGANTLALAEQSERQLPYTLSDKNQTITVSGLKIDIEYVAKQLEIKGFRKED